MSAAYSLIRYRSLTFVFLSLLLAIDAWEPAVAAGDSQTPVVGRHRFEQIIELSCSKARVGNAVAQLKRQLGRPVTKATVVEDGQLIMRLGTDVEAALSLAEAEATQSFTALATTSAEVEMTEKSVEEDRDEDAALARRPSSESSQLVSSSRSDATVVVGERTEGSGTDAERVDVKTLADLHEYFVRAHRKMQLMGIFTEIRIAQLSALQNMPDELWQNVINADSDPLNNVSLMPKLSSSIRNDCGSFSEVFQVSITECDTSMPFVFKPAASYEEIPWRDRTFLAEVLKWQGKSGTNLRFSEHNVATYLADQLLGLNVIPKTQFASATVNGKLRSGVLMRKVEGVTGAKFFRRASSSMSDIGPLLNEPGLAPLSSRLNLLDVWLGQMDRHLGNFFIKSASDENEFSLQGIDNDLAFPLSDAFPVEGVIDTVPVDYRWRYPGLANHVDRYVAIGIVAISPEIVDEVFKDVLDREEISALKRRLERLQTALKRRTLVESPEWRALDIKLVTDARHTGHLQRWFEAAQFARGTRRMADFIGPVDSRSVDLLASFR